MYSKEAQWQKQVFSKANECKMRNETAMPASTPLILAASSNTADTSLTAGFSLSIFLLFPLNKIITLFYY